MKFKLIKELITNYKDPVLRPTVIYLVGAVIVLMIVLALGIYEYFVWGVRF